MHTISSLPPTTFVILGGTGNLAETKLLPALFDLFVQKVLPTTFAIVGVSRKTLGNDGYQSYIRRVLNEHRPRADRAHIEAFVAAARYSAGDFDSETTYQGIRAVLEDIDGESGQCTNKLFYLAVPPQFYSAIFSHLAGSGVMRLCNNVTAWSRILVEKPFGRDLETAQALEEQLCALFSEEQIYRIDHYLAKDAIENIIALRFSNRVLSDSWHRDEVASIEIRVVETKDVATRGAFYDGVGALRDVGQNHLLQILALLTMRAVDIHKVSALRAARAEVLGALRSPRTVVLGQYEGYHDSAGVATDSRTETYFRIETELDVPEWQGVPIVLEAGKALDRSLAEAVITFRSKDVCNCGAEAVPHHHHNVLTLTLSPTQRITLTLFAKRPGFAFTLEPRELELTASAATDDYSPEAYERVLYDCMVGDQSRFVSGDEVMAAWRFITPLLSTAPIPLSYPPGTPGPNGA